MKVADYVKKNKGALPPELAEMVLSETSIWTNDACYGYCIEAMEKADVDRETITKVVRGLHQAFDELTVEEAERKWVSW